MKKPTRWLSNCPEILAMLDVKCSGDHEHEECNGAQHEGLVKSIPMSWRMQWFVVCSWPYKAASTKG